MNKQQRRAQLYDAMTRPGKPTFTAEELTFCKQHDINLDTGSIVAYDMSEAQKQYIRDTIYKKMMEVNPKTLLLFLNTPDDHE